MSNSNVYIIAEIGPNHNGSVETALKMIDLLAETGVDAIKFQLSIPENAYSLDSFKPTYQRENEGSPSPIEMSKKYQLSFEDHLKLRDRCESLKVDYMCSAFELSSLLFLDNNIDLPFFKIASGEMFSVDMCNYMSQRHKPIILSTGMATFADIQTVLDLLNENFKKDITILHCVSNYPAPYETINLLMIPELKRRFQYNVGFSDHTIGNEAAIAAVALGASIIEKHVTLNNTMEGPDHKASITIKEFGELVKSIRNVELMMGSSSKSILVAEQEIKSAVRKSIVAKKDLLPGHVIMENDITYKRPGFGFLPIEKGLILGRKVKTKIDANRVIKSGDIEWQ